MNVPVASSIVAKGYNVTGQLVAQQTFQYPFTSGKEGMMLGTPKAGFGSGLFNVTFEQGGGLLSTAEVGILDSVTLYTCTS